MNEDKDSPAGKLWHQFAQSEKLSVTQRRVLEHFYCYVRAGNKVANLTRIVTLDKFIALHLQDSLAIRRFIDLSKAEGIVDIGTGAGFPGIPLAIACPDLPVYLLEVHSKRLHFLENLLMDIKIPNCEIIDLDWRTFLRKTTYPIDYMFARASLTPRELVRAFKPTCPYNNTTIVYWASGRWTCPPSIEPFFKKEVSYGIKKRTHKFVFLTSRQMLSK
jgi:16S rRNA (guanine(527)-N(7))-methyltransferase RsmG